MKTTLREIIEASIEQALELSRLDSEAEREKLRQKMLSDKVDAEVGSRKESEKKQLEADEDDVVGKDAPTRAKPPEGQDTQSKDADKADKKSDIDPKDIDADALIDKFNIIRSGRSMNDREISTALTKYINSLQPSIRSTLFDVIKNVAHVVAPGADTERLTKPPEEPTAVQNARLQMLQKRREDKEKAAEKRELELFTSKTQTTGGKPPEKEDVSPPVKVGKKQQTRPA
jgi:hypothetical protein